MDANEILSDPNSKIHHIFEETDLIDLHYHCFPAQPKPAMHQRGSQPIDLIVGSPLLASALVHAWILPFGAPPLIKGDHRLLGLDFSPEILFGNNTHSLALGLLHGINSKNDQHVRQYCTRVVRACNLHNLNDRIALLLQKPCMSKDDTAELESIDQTITKFLVNVDRQCRPFQVAPWSRDIQTAYLAHRFWALTFSANKNERNLSSALASIAKRLDPALTLRDPGRSLSAHLRQAQKQLKKVRRDAAKHRKAHLEAILNQACAANQHKKTVALKYLIRAERNRQCYACFCQHTKPKSSGGLAFVTVTLESSAQTPLLEREALENTLLEYSRTHFARAEGSPFTQEPLGRLLQYDGLTSFGDRITRGQSVCVLHHFDEPTTAILNNLQRKTPMIPSDRSTLDYVTLLQGIKKWPERTTTLPSGRHLGIYKSLAKHVIEKKKTTAAQVDNSKVLEGPLMQGRVFFT